MIPADWGLRLVETLLGNAIAVTVLALVVLLVSRWIRSPAVRHALWAVVLVRALMPPVIPVPALPVGTLAWLAEPTETTSDPIVLEPTPSQGSSSQGPAVGILYRPSRDPVTRLAEPRLAEPSELAMAGLRARGDLAPSRLDLSPPAAAQEQVPASKTTDLVLTAGTWLPTPAQLGRNLLALWIFGAVATLALAGFRLARFRRALGPLEPSTEELEHRAHALADGLGLRRCPPVLITERRIPPLVWAPLGRPRILLPRALVERLSMAERETVLAHELSHVARCDHWLRAVELVAGIVFWWHPVVAWARKQLRECEEAACDQRVLTLLPNRARAYAEAVLETLDLTARPPAEPALPALASGLQSKNRTLEHLEGRLQMILHGKTSSPLPWPLRLTLALAACAALLVLPTRTLEAGGEGTESDAAIQALEEAKDLERAQLELETQALELETEARRAELERLKEDTQRSRLRQELQVRELEARLEHARETADANAEVELVAELEAARAQHEIDAREWQLEMERIQTELDLERRMHVLELDTRRRVLDEGAIDREEVMARRRQIMTEMLERRQQLSEREQSARVLAMKAEREQVEALRQRLEGRTEMAEALARREAEMARQHEEMGRRMELQRLHVEAELERHRLEQEVEAGRLSRDQAEESFRRIETEVEAKQQDLLRYHVEQRIEDLQRELPTQIAEMRRQLEESGVDESEIAESLQALRRTLEESLRSFD